MDNVYDHQSALGSKHQPPDSIEEGIHRSYANLLLYESVSLHHPSHRTLSPRCPSPLPDAFRPPMQHISIDYMLHTSASDISEADRLVSTRIQSVFNGCPTLRTFTLHLLTFFQNDDLHRNLSSDSRTALELSRLAARLPDATNRLESISIVTHGHDLFLTDLLDGIAPPSCWTVCRPLEWPDISIDEHQKEGMERREDGVVCQQTWRYYLWPACTSLLKTDGSVLRLLRRDN